MVGLRERKKREVRHRTIEAAEGLFAAKGLDATTMEDIARAADVSVATVYNYFGSKSALLLAAIEEETDGMIALGKEVLVRPGTNPMKAVQRLLDAYASHFARWDPRLLREVLSASFQRGIGEGLTAELAAMDQRLIDQLATLLHGFQARGRLEESLDVVDATLLLFSNFTLHLLIGMSTEGLIADDLRGRIARQVELAFAGLNPPDR